MLLAVEAMAFRDADRRLQPLFRSGAAAPDMYVQGVPRIASFEQKKNLRSF